MKVENRLPLRDDMLNVTRYRGRDSTNLFDTAPGQNDALFVREIPISNIDNLMYGIKDGTEYEKLKEFVEKIKLYWSKVSEYGIKVVPFSCVISKLSNKGTGILIVAEKVIKATDSGDIFEQIKRTKLITLLKKFKKYYHRGDDGSKFWVDVSDRVDSSGQFVYGRLSGELEDDWYLVDLDPKFKSIQMAKPSFLNLVSGFQKYNITDEDFN